MSDIINDLSNCTSHRSHSYKTCKSIQIIEEYINNGNTLSEKVFEKFISTLKDNYCIDSGFWIATAIKYIKNMKNCSITMNTFKYFTCVPIDFLQNMYTLGNYKIEIRKLVLEFYSFGTIQLFLNDIIFDDSNVCLLLKNNKLCGSECKQLLNIRSQTIKKNLPPEALLNFFKNSHFIDNAEILDLLLFIGCTPDEKSICYLCEKGKYSILKRLLNGNIKITDEMYNATHDVYRYNRYDGLETRALIIDLLVENGYIITQNHIESSILKGYYINNIEDHIKKNGMTHDDIYNFQKKHKTYYKYPYTVVSDIMIPNLLYFATIHNKGLQFIMQIIIRTSIIPDLEYLEDICNMSDMGDIIDFVLDKYKIPITKKCFTNSTNAGSIKNLSQLVKKLPDGIIKCIDNDTKHNSTVNNSAMDNNKDIKILKLGKPSNFPKNTKTKNKVSDDCIKLLNLRSDMVSFLDLKKKALDYAKNNFLLDKNYIKINKNLSNIINIEENSCIQFTDFDNIVARLYQN